MILEGVRHRLDLDALQLTELHRLELELQRVPLDLSDRHVASDTSDG